MQNSRFAFFHIIKALLESNLQRNQVNARPKSYIPKKSSSNITLGFAERNLNQKININSPKEGKNERRVQKKNKPNQKKKHLKQNQTKVTSPGLHTWPSWEQLLLPEPLPEPVPSFQLWWPQKKWFVGFGWLVLCVFCDSSIYFYIFLVL